MAKWALSREDLPLVLVNAFDMAFTSAMAIDWAPGDASLLIAKLIRWSRTTKSTLRLTSPLNPAGVE